MVSFSRRGCCTATPPCSARSPPIRAGTSWSRTAAVIAPEARPLKYVDYWGTVVHAFDVHVPHTELERTRQSLLDVPVAPRILGAARRP